MKRVFLKLLLFVLTLVSVISYVFGFFFLFLIISEQASAEEMNLFIIFFILFPISAYFAGYLHWERKLDFHPAELGFWEWPFVLLKFLGNFFVYHVYLFVKYLRMRIMKNIGRSITYQEFLKEQEAEWYTDRQEKRKS